MSFEILEHTGDVGIRYFGKTVEELFSSAVVGTASLIGEPESGCIRDRKTMNFRWTDLIDLMYQLLDHIIYAFEVDEILLDSLDEMNYSDRENTVITLSGCRIGANFRYGYIMKAPTYHQMEINTEKGYGIQIFDI